MDQAKILVADDDKEIVHLIAESLEDEGFEVVKAYSGQEVLTRTKTPGLSLVLLDIMMPGEDGLSVCRKIRHTISAPIIFLSAKDKEIDKIVGLEVGADDYITKPFSINELIARVKAHLRRDQRYMQLSELQQNILTSDNLIIHKDSYEVYKGGEKIDLSTKEFQILLYLAERKNKVLSREQIYEAIWGDSEFGDIHTVTVHIRNLRNKLDPENRFIKTVWGIGYKFTGGSLK